LHPSQEQFVTRGGVDVAKGDIRTYNEDGVWKTKVEGSSRAAHTGGTKAEQQAVGRDMAKERGVEHTISKLDGTIGEKNSYGGDPTATKG
jgi:hypothetical protein